MLRNSLNEKGEKVVEFIRFPLFNEKSAEERIKELEEIVAAQRRDLDDFEEHRAATARLVKAQRHEIDSIKKGEDISAGTRALIREMYEKAYWGGTMKPGQFFKHESGRAIAVLGQVKSFLFGNLFVIEEINPVGHYVVDASKDLDDSWVEIGKPEWKRDIKRFSKAVTNG